MKMLFRELAGGVWIFIVSLSPQHPVTLLSSGGNLGGIIKEK